MEKLYDSQKALLDKDSLDNAWSQVNFGEGAHPIKTIGSGLVKRSLGYHVGSGMHFLLTETGLTDEQGNVTNLGYDFLMEPYKRY